MFRKSLPDSSNQELVVLTLSLCAITLWCKTCITPIKNWLNRLVVVSLFLASFSVTVVIANDIETGTSSGEHQQLLESLGRAIFFDKRLSQPEGQSCASCHKPEFAYSDREISVSPGATTTLISKRNAPSIVYSSMTPNWHFNAEDDTWIGGFFVDGRAMTLEEQAVGPLFDPLEMALPSEQVLVERVRTAPYAKLVASVNGDDVWINSKDVVSIVAKALAAFQSSESFAPRFSAKYDAYLRGKTELTEQEARGLNLFEAQDKGNCAACHQSQIGENGEWPLFTDFSYDNLGVPKNPRLAFLQLGSKYNPLGERFVDRGLADNPHISNSDAQLGKFKVPTLRNIAVTSPYMHNSFFTELKDAVEFYNSRDIEEKWSTPEIAQNVNKDELGDLKLTPQEVEDIVSFLQTLTDGWTKTGSK